MLLNRNDQELAAMRRLSVSPDFDKFLAWLKRDLAAKQTALPAVEDAIRLRWGQGQAQALQEILQAVEDTRKVTDRREQ